MALTVALIVAWAVLLRPQLLGGPAAYVIVSGASMEPALANGDLVVATKKDSYRVGDVVAYRVAKGEPGDGALVIHRVVGGSATAGYLTKGDNREGRDLWRPRPNDVLGSVSVRLPRAGLLLALIRTPLGLAALAGLMTFLFVSAGRKREATVPAAGRRIRSKGRQRGRGASRPRLGLRALPTGDRAHLRRRRPTTRA
jgi:signal peptidase